MRWKICAGTSIVAIRTRPAPSPARRRRRCCRHRRCAGRMSCAVSPMIARDWLSSSQMPTVPSRATLAIDLPSSISPCTPKMRLRPLERIELVALEGEGAGAKAERTEQRRRAERGDQGEREQAGERQRDQAEQRRTAAPGSKSRRSAASKLSTGSTIVSSAPTIIGPASAIQAAPPSTTKRGAQLAWTEGRRPSPPRRGGAWGSAPRFSGLRRVRRPWPQPPERDRGATDRGRRGSRR